MNLTEILKNNQKIMDIIMSIIIIEFFLFDSTDVQTLTERSTKAVLITFNMLVTIFKTKEHVEMPQLFKKKKASIDRWNLGSVQCAADTAFRLYRKIFVHFVFQSTVCINNYEKTLILHRQNLYQVACNFK